MGGKRNWGMQGGMGGGGGGGGGGEKGRGEGESPHPLSSPIYQTLLPL